MSQPQHAPETQITASTRCDKILSGDGVMSYHCTLPQGHATETTDPADPQPCYVLESRKARQAWSDWQQRQLDRARIKQVTEDVTVIDCPECGEHSMRINWLTRVAQCEPCGAVADVPDITGTDVATAEEIAEDVPEGFTSTASTPDPEVMAAAQQTLSEGVDPSQHETFLHEQIRAGRIHNHLDPGCVKSNESGPYIEGEPCQICNTTYRIEEEDGWAQGKWEVRVEDGRPMTGMTKQLAMGTMDDRLTHGLSRHHLRVVPDSLTTEQMDAILRGEHPRGVPDIPGVTVPLTGIASASVGQEAPDHHLAVCQLQTCTETEVHGHNDGGWMVLPRPTKQREGDQTLPAGGDRVVQDEIIAHLEHWVDTGVMTPEDAGIMQAIMEESKRVGLERYGQYLKTFDGRRNIRDLADELRDGLVYVTKMQMTAQADRETLVRMVKEAMGDISPIPEGFDPDRYAEVAVDRILDWVLTQRIGPEQVRPNV